VQRCAPSERLMGPAEAGALASVRHAHVFAPHSSGQRRSGRRAASSYPRRLLIALESRTMRYVLGKRQVRRSVTHVVSGVAVTHQTPRWSCS